MASLERFALAPDLTICRMLNGMWQASGAHGRIEREKAKRRLGLSDHRADNTRVFAFGLDAEDHARIEAVLAKSRDLLSVIGDCGDEYR